MEITFSFTFAVAEMRSVHSSAASCAGSKVQSDPAVWVGPEEMSQLESPFLGITRKVFWFITGTWCTNLTYAFIPVIESNQIWINCQVLRELG